MSVTIVERCNGYALVTLNRPAALNALSRELRRELAATVYTLEADPEIGGLILTGAGRAFCAGVDLKELGQTGSLDLDDDAADPVEAVSRFSGPVIGAINGVAITGGFELALACDVLIGSEAARFADTHALVGVIPGWGLSQKLSRAVGIYRAKELSLTGRFLNAESARDWGLLNRVTSAAEMLPQACAMMEDMLEASPQMLADYKRLIDDGFAASFGDAMAMERTRSLQLNARVTAELVEARRGTVQAHGRSQAG